MNHRATENLFTPLYSSFGNDRSLVSDIFSPFAIQNEVIVPKFPDTKDNGLFIFKQ